jgi:hypothetical protein
MCSLKLNSYLFDPLIPVIRVDPRFHLNFTKFYIIYYVACLLIKLRYARF